jgi:hypothetical protein
MEARILRQSWKRSDWLRCARNEPHSVQAVAPMLDLRTADQVWCRNQVTKVALIELGFDPEQVIVRRLAVGYSSE